jgi:kynureninase
VIRIGLSPLTTRFTDVHDGLQTLRDLIKRSPSSRPHWPLHTASCSR